MMVRDWVDNGGKFRAAGCPVINRLWMDYYY